MRASNNIWGTFAKKRTAVCFILLKLHMVLQQLKCSNNSLLAWVQWFSSESLFFKYSTYVLRWLSSYEQFCTNNFVRTGPCVLFSANRDWRTIYCVNLCMQSTNALALATIFCSFKISAILCYPLYLPFENARGHFKNFGKDHEATLDFLTNLMRSSSLTLFVPRFFSCWYDRGYANLRSGSILQIIAWHNP